MKLFILVIAFLLNTTCWAYGLSDAELSRAVSLGYGVTAPSLMSSLYENPAGIGRNQKYTLVPFMYSSTTSFNPIGFGGNMYFGNGTAGAGLGVQTIESGNTRTTTANLSVGAEIQSLKFAIGVNGLYRLSPSTGSRWDANIGAVFNPRGSFHVGAQVFGVNGGVNAYGLGIAVDPSANVSFGADAITSNDIKGTAVKPGLGIHIREVQVAVGYGIGLDKANGMAAQEGFSFGLAVPFNESIRLEGYYKQLQEIFISIGIRL